MPASQEREKIPAKPPGSFRLLHTADWHLGKLLNDRSRDEEHAQFLEWLLVVVQDHEVDAIVLAGDVFDTANPPQSALARYFNFVSELFRQGDCALLAIAGNHDSAAQLEAPKQALHALNTYVVGALAEDPQDRILCLPDAASPRVAIAMVPFLRDRDLRVGKPGETAEEIRASIIEGIEKRYRETAAAAASLDCPVLATGHLTVSGATISDSEREIHIGGLGAVTPGSFPAAFPYLALGHLHRPQAVGDNPGIRYAGSPIPLSFSEASDRKQVRVLDVVGDTITQHGLAIPVSRRLVQLRTRYAELEKSLKELQPETGSLTTWMEVVVEDATLQDDLVERVRQLTQGRDFEVLKVLRGSPSAFTGMNVDEATDDEAIASLLGDPRAVFKRLLEEHEEPLEAQEIVELEMTFARLVELEEQSEPHPVV